MKYNQVVSKRIRLKEMIGKQVGLMWEINDAAIDGEPNIKAAARDALHCIDLEIAHLEMKLKRVEHYLSHCHGPDNILQHVAPFIFDCDIDMDEVPF